ncbi:MAG TPA: hypothetical protein VEH05_15195 [Streptosporangiaceae bacterium]|nr:hypothetical protein [Streptosporangiaceae bacterium]
MTWFTPAARAATNDAHVLPGLFLAGLAVRWFMLPEFTTCQGGPQ